MLSPVRVSAGLAEQRGWFVCGLPGCENVGKLHVVAVVLCLAPMGLGIYVAVRHVWLGLLFAPLAFLLAALHCACIYAAWWRSDGNSPSIDLPTRLLLVSATWRTVTARKPSSMPCSCTSSGPSSGAAQI